MHNPPISIQPSNQASPWRYLPDHLWRDWQAGEVAASLDHLRAVLHAVSTYLPRQVVRVRLSDPTQPAAAAAFTEATLMFADISGFTAMSERMTQLGREGAEVITGIVNEYFAAMLGIIAQHDGDLFKFGGDALLVCFSGDGAAVRACGAALAMQDAMKRFAVIETEQGTFNLRMKAGLGTGPFLSASLGLPERLEFAVIGPTLGRMAKAESLAQPGEVLIDIATRDAASTDIVTLQRAPGFFQLAGMTGPLYLGDPADRAVSPTEGLLVDPSDAEELIKHLDALGPYIPPRVLERIVASPRQRMIEGEHRLVTVLFANLFGIDEIIAALGPDLAQEITTALNQHFIAMQRVIHRYGGIINKVDTYAVGYRIMALFGAPVAHEDDPVRAVHAALEMQEALEVFNRSEAAITSAERFELKQRIGINTGYVFAGNVGSAVRQEYSVMGDEVNLAARLMGIASHGQVLISQSTARYVAGTIEWQPREPVRVKGKQQPVPNFQVTRRVTIPESRHVTQGLFFGRQMELTASRALVDAALTGQGAVVDISGDAGVGKSRLVAELAAYADEQGLVTFRSEAVSFSRGIPYLPWLAILHPLLEFEEDRLETSEQRSIGLIAGLERAGLSEWAPIVGRVLGVEIPDTPLTAALDAQMRQQRFFDVVLQLLQEHTKRSPVLLVLDDMQWADGVSLDLVSYVARNAPGFPLVFVIVHRTDLEMRPWCADEGCLTLHLAEMTEEDSLALAGAVLGQGDLAPPLRRLIYDRAQGNPLFVEEVARALRESGAIKLVRRDEAVMPSSWERAEGSGDLPVWVLSEIATDVDVPTTLTGLIMSRIDRLEMVNRRLLQVAAVIGVDFRVSTLTRIYPYEDLDGTLQHRLAELERMDLTEFVPPEAYVFKHTLTQEVAYSSLPFTRRRELHVSVGEDIEQHHTGDLAEYFGVLARHFDEGRAFDKAFGYLSMAGERARQEYANEAALDYFRRALEIADTLAADDVVETRLLDVREATGDVLRVVGRYVEAIEQFQDVIAHQLCTTGRRASLLAKIARAYDRQGQYDQALQYLAQGRRLLSDDAQGRHVVEMARIFFLSGWVRRRRGEMEAAIEACEQGLAILVGLERGPEVLSIEADLYNTLADVFLGQGNYTEAAKVYQRSTTLREQAGDLPGLARSYNNLAITAVNQRDLTGARDYFQRMLEISRLIGNNYFLAYGYLNLGGVLYKAGDRAQALEYYHTALAVQQRIGDSYGAALARNNIGEAHFALGQYAEARRYLLQAADNFEAIHSEVELSEVYRLLAEVELAQTNFPTALDYAERARRVAVSTGNPEWQGIAERVLAQGLVQKGDIARARQSFEASVALLAESENEIELACSCLELGLLLAQQAGSDEQAREFLQKAIDLFTAGGEDEQAIRARAALAQLDA